jgi:hypothetical protein
MTTAGGQLVDCGRKTCRSQRPPAASRLSFWSSRDYLSFRTRHFIPPVSIGGLPDFALHHRPQRVLRDKTINKKSHLSDSII